MPKKQRYKNIETTTFIEDQDVIKVESLIRSFNVPKKAPIHHIFDMYRSVRPYVALADECMAFKEK
jgi:hypothetical protein